MKAEEKWIIDTNLIVYWLVSSQILPFAITRFGLSEAFLATYKNRYEPSLSFVDKVLEAPKHEGRFSVVELSLNELFSGIRDEIRTIILFVKGVPMSRWAHKRETSEVSFPVDLSEKVHKLTLQGFDILFATKKIAITRTIGPSDFDDYFDVYSSLVFLNPGMKTQDAILIAHAIFDKADHFVTTDESLLKLGKELRKNYGLDVVKPQRALEVMRARK